MCIRDRLNSEIDSKLEIKNNGKRSLSANGSFNPSTKALDYICLLYTSDAADERSSVDLGGRRIIKKKKRKRLGSQQIMT